ncbi:hypothetical protein CKA32_000258 [Geitlerinema sp. FC II]|nr:hypothetical protein CKA32_000258 [Geitlerinema sp. FC II]
MCAPKDLKFLAPNPLDRRVRSNVQTDFQCKAFDWPYWRQNLENCKRFLSNPIPFSQRSKRFGTYHKARRGEG